MLVTLTATPLPDVARPVERAQRLVDTLFAVPNDAPPPGLIAAHVHISTGGSHVLNYAEWASAEGRQTAIVNRPREIEENKEWQEVHV